MKALLEDASFEGVAEALADAASLDDGVGRAVCDEITLTVLAIDTEGETDDDGLCAGGRDAAAEALTDEDSDGDDDGSGVAVDADKLTTADVVASIERDGLTEEDCVGLADVL